jgi:hypothetical protein
MPGSLTDDPIVRELTTAITGRYVLERELGRGGMGAVFLARDLRLDRSVAIKVLPPELAVRPELRERFLRETRTAASFSHPNIVAVHAVEETAQLLYFVMSYVDGETLTQRVRRQGPLTAADATRLVQEVAWALSYAHGRGVVHRDVKPDNILIERATGRALVMDFGIARSVAASGLTQTGETVGTPHFMSPEQVAGEVVDGRSDLYSLGVVGYYALTGRLVFEADSAQAVMVAHISQTPVPIARYRPDLPPALSGAIDRCLAKDPADRFATGEALVESLDQVRSRQAEIAPAVRVWTARADQIVRNSLLLSLILPQLVVKFNHPIAQAVFSVVIFAGILPALWAQIPLGMRELAQQGFTYADLRAGVLAIDGERRAVLAALLADPRRARRRRMRLLALVGIGVVAVLAGSLALSNRVEVAPGSYRVSSTAMAVFFVAIVVGMVCLVLAVATIASAGGLDRRLHRLWSGRVGALLFRLGSWRLPTQGRGGAAQARTGAATLFDSLDRGLRRRLGQARGTLARVDGALARLEQRELELQSAAREARAHTPTPGLATGDRQQALLEELDRARAAVVERRVALLAALENVRLALVRAKSGLGTTEDVERELSAIAAISEIAS